MNVQDFIDNFSDISSDSDEEEGLDVNKILQILDDDNEEDTRLLETTRENIEDNKFVVLNELGLTNEKLLDFSNKLENYRYIDDIKDLRYNGYIKWISLKNPEKIKLSRGAFICDMKVSNNGINILCILTSRNYKRIFNISMTENLIFQRISDNEHMLLSIVDYLKQKND